jgi:hypothetical protein
MGWSVNPASYIPRPDPKTDLPKVLPWERRVQLANREAQRDLFRAVTPWDGNAYELHKSRIDPGPALDFLDKSLGVSGALQDRLRQGLAKFDDRIAAARAAAGFPVLADHAAAPIIKERNAWAAANPAGLSVAERQQLQQILANPREWGDDGRFSVGRFNVEMSVANAVVVAEGGQITSSSGGSAGGADTTGSRDVRTKDVGGKLGLELGKGGFQGAGSIKGNVSVEGKMSWSHEDNRSHTDSSGKSTGTSVTSAAQTQEVTVRARITDPATGAVTEVSLGRVKVKTSND